MLAKIVELQLGRIRQRLQDNHGMAFNVSDAAVKLIVSRCTEVESGGRMVDAILTNTVLPHVSQKLLESTIAGETIAALNLDAQDGEFVYQYSE